MAKVNMKETEYYKSGKQLEQLKIASSHAHKTKIKCIYCEKETTKAVHKRHIDVCYLNPANKKLCPVCDKPIINWKTGTTCSYSCSNKYFNRVYRNRPEKYTNYRTIGFHHHTKECIICNESNIVAIHHLDENHKNNDPKNLVPLCPTHHNYMHSRFKYLIEDQVQEYVNGLSL
jgi:hypothetical protein